MQITGKIDYAWKYDHIILIRFVSENRCSTGRYVFIIRSKYFLMFINDYFILKIKKSDIKPVSQMCLVTNVNALSPVSTNNANTRRCYVVLAAQYDPISNPLLQHMRGSRGGQGVRIPLENHWVPSSAHHRTPLKWRFACRPMVARLGDIDTTLSLLYKI